MDYKIDEIRNDFPILRTKANNQPLIYLDNAATTHKPKQVLSAISKYYNKHNANVHRGVYELSVKSTEAYHNARLKVADLIGANDWRSIIFTSGTTESINLVASAWGRKNLKPGDEIVLTQMEHHSNIVPWQMISKDTEAVIRFISLNADGSLDIDNLGDLITEKTKVVSLIHQSNVFGTVNPIKKIITVAKAVGALTVVDAAQSVPHSSVDVNELDCDFLAFSGHKMLGPTGIGVLYGKNDILEAMPPFQGGGDMINNVTMDSATWNDIPYKFEAGTPNIAQAVGLGAAIDYLNSIGFDAIHSYEKYLTDYALKMFESLPDFTLYGSQEMRGPVFSFNFSSIHPHDLAQFLDQDGIAVRAGHHCAQPAMDFLKVSATLRASLYIYNTLQEIDHLHDSLIKIRSLFKK
ncbi:cysteine desulfurase [Candidatus Neomarinimicrobiota bacterium]